MDPVCDVRVLLTAVRQSSREESILGVAEVPVPVSGSWGPGVPGSRGPGAAIGKKTKEERRCDGPVTQDEA